MPDITDEIVITGERKQNPPSDEVSIILPNRGATISGWQRVRITRGVERVPSDFEITATERYSTAADLTVLPGEPCVLKIGDDAALTGYVDRFMPTIDANSHVVTIAGRGKCSDLVDCSAIWPGGQISGNGPTGIAQKLADPYGIKVTLASGVEPQKPIPRIQLSYGETVFALIERVARYYALLAYEDTDGNLLLDRVGTIAAGSGFTEGKNIERAAAIYSMDQRFSEYDVMSQSMERAADIGLGGDLLFSAYDKFVPRFRLMALVSEAGTAGQTVGLQRALWEAARRFGRSFVISLTTDSWRDGTQPYQQLWAPNTTVGLDIPTLKVSPDVRMKWVVSEVTFRRDETGTHADLVLMPSQAFLPEPILLMPSFEGPNGTQTAPGAR